MKKPAKKNEMHSTHVKCIFNKTRETLLLTRGMDRLVLANRRFDFDLEDAVSPFKPSVPDVKSKTLGLEAQMNIFQKLMSNPLKGNGTYLLNSFPTDLRAKQLAAVVMDRAVDLYTNMDAHAKRGKTLPLWIKLTGYGGLDQLKDIRDMNPALLILSNVNDESTPHKLEKLRDILEHTDSIPKIVVTAGQDPVTFFARRLYYTVAGAIRIGSKAKVNLMDL